MSGVSEPWDRVAGVRRFGVGGPSRFDLGREVDGNECISIDHVLITVSKFDRVNPNYLVLAGEKASRPYPTTLLTTPLCDRHHLEIVSWLTNSAVVALGQLLCEPISGVSWGVGRALPAAMAHACRSALFDMCRRCAARAVRRVVTPGLCSAAVLRPADLPSFWLRV